MLLQSRDTLYQISHEAYTKDDIVFGLFLLGIVLFFIFMVLKYALMSRDLQNTKDELHKLEGRSDANYKELAEILIKRLTELIEKEAKRK